MVGQVQFFTPYAGTVKAHERTITGIMRNRGSVLGSRAVEAQRPLLLTFGLASPALRTLMQESTSKSEFRISLLMMSEHVGREEQGVEGMYSGSDTTK